MDTKRKDEGRNEEERLEKRKNNNRKEEMEGRCVWTSRVLQVGCLSKSFKKKERR